MDCITPLSEESSGPEGGDLSLRFHLIVLERSLVVIAEALTNPCPVVKVSDFALLEAPLAMEDAVEALSAIKSRLWSVGSHL